MTTYRIYYVEREAGGDASLDRIMGGLRADPESEWEETYDGRDAAEALEAFFRDHAGHRDNVRILDEDGTPRGMDGFADYDPDRTYVWIEDGKFMEYQGLDEATPGMVACPLCDGSGEVDEATAEEFAEVTAGEDDE